MATKTSKKTYEVPNKSGGFTTVTSTSKAGAVSQVGSNANLKSGGSSNSSNVPTANTNSGIQMDINSIQAELTKRGVQSNPVINAQNTKPSEKLPTSNAPVDNYAGTVASAQGVVTPVTEQSVQTGAQKTFQDYLDNQKAPPDLMSIQNKLEKDNQIKQKQQNVNNYQTQLNSIVAKAQADVLSTQGQGRGIPEAIIGGQQAQINREAAIQALPIQALLSSAQGDLQMAEAHIDKLFGIYAKDAENKVNHYNRQADLVYGFLSKQEQQQIDSLKQDKLFKQGMLEKKLDAQQSYATQALKDGNITLFNRLTAIQPPTNVNSSTYQQDLVSYEQKVNNAVAKYGIVASTGGNESSAPKITKINGVDSVWNGKEFVPVQLGGTPNNIVVSSTKEKVDTINNLLVSGGLKGSVGATIFSRSGGGGLDQLTGKKSEFLAGVQQLASQLTLDNLINAKANGATFGALSEGELRLLDAGASKLKTWSITDKNGNFTGFKTSEKVFKAELDKINYYAKKDYVLKGGSPTDVNAQVMSDGTVWVINSDGTYSKIQ